MAEERGSGEDRRGEENIAGADERHAHHPSDVDARGLDKRRQVVGGQYGVPLRKQLTLYGVFVVVATVLVIAFLTVVSSIDNREIPLEPNAPWSEAASLPEPRPIDYPRNGPINTIPVQEIERPADPATPDADTEAETRP